MLKKPVATVTTPQRFESVYPATLSAATVMLSKPMCSKADVGSAEMEGATSDALLIYK